MDASDSHYIRNVEAFRDFIAVEERIDGLDQVRLIDRSGQSRYVQFPESAYTAGIDNNPEFETNTLRLEYSSMVTPSTVFDYHIGTGQLEVRKVQQVPSGYDASEYMTERVLIMARDGVQVPASIVRRRDTPVDGSAPLYLYGYGAYGFAMPPSFSTTRLSLLDRGFIFAIGHIRGGDDLGYHWYEAGKLDRRTNTFNDFVDVARGLVAMGYGSAGTHRHSRGQRRRAADGGRRKPGSGTLGRSGGSRALRGRAEHHAGRHPSAHAHRVAGVGQPPSRTLPHSSASGHTPLTTNWSGASILRCW